MRGIEKRFGAITALAGAHLYVGAGEALGIVGDNGAGKSTLMKILSGAEVPDAGQVLIDGSEVHFNTPRDAHEAGIEMVYQDLALCDDLDVAANFFLGRELRRFGLSRAKRMHELTRTQLGELGVHLPSTTVRIKSLSGGQRQAVAIGRSASFTPKVLVLDEPTAALGVREVEHVLDLIRRIKEAGVAVLVISHRLQDLFAVCERISVMYEGRTERELEVADTTIEEIVNAIVGPSARRLRGG